MIFFFKKKLYINLADNQFDIIWKQLSYKMEGFNWSKIFVFSTTKKSVSILRCQNISGGIKNKKSCIDWIRIHHTVKSKVRLRNYLELKM